MWTLKLHISFRSTCTEGGLWIQFSITDSQYEQEDLLQQEKRVLMFISAPDLAFSLQCQQVSYTLVVALLTKRKDLSSAISRIDQQSTIKEKKTHPALILAS